MGFISNQCERSEMIGEQRKQQTAEAIANGILKYLNKK
jgi:N-acetylmuramoyl-L-alanine amidase